MFTGWSTAHEAEAPNTISTGKTSVASFHFEVRILFSLLKGLL